MPNECNSETPFQRRQKVNKGDSGYQTQAFTHRHLHTCGHTDTHTGGNERFTLLSIYKSVNLIVPITTIEAQFKTRWCCVDCGYYNIKENSPSAWKTSWRLKIKSPRVLFNNYEKIKNKRCTIHLREMMDLPAAVSAFFEILSWQVNTALPDVFSIEVHYNMLQLLLVIMHL